MKLKELCERTGITKRNVHYYIKEGLLVPRKELGNGYYEFSQEDCDRLQMIRSLRNAGFSILQIRSILSKPSTSGYYINLRLKELKSEIEHANSAITALSYIQERLPLHIRYQKLEELVREAGIPSYEPRETIAQDFESYDNDLINRFLWESFLPDSPMTDYQEYLWSKVIDFRTATVPAITGCSARHFIASAPGRSKRSSPGTGSCTMRSFSCPVSIMRTMRGK